MIIIIIAMDFYLCLHCEREVRPRQEAIQCEQCEGWQHRTCHTGMCFFHLRLSFLVLMMFIVIQLSTFQSDRILISPNRTVFIEDHIERNVHSDLDLYFMQKFIEEFSFQNDIRVYFKSILSPKCLYVLI